MPLPEISIRTRLLMGALLILLVCGCGGGSHVSKKTGRGTAVFTIKWPAVQKRSRLIPAATNRIRVQIVPNADGTGTNYGSQDAERPQSDSAPLLTTPTTTLIFNNLPPGQFYTTATAYPDDNPASIAQAKAIVPLTIADGQTTTSNLTMNTTITQVLFQSPTNVPPDSQQTTGRFTPFTFTPQAQDSAGNAVLLASPLQVTQSDTSIANITGSGTFAIRNAGKLGTVTITVKEPESGFTQSFTLTFLPAIYLADSGNSRIVRMDDMKGTNFVAYGTQGNGTGNFNAPHSVAVDAQGSIYVADSGNNRIVMLDNGVFTPSGGVFTFYGTPGSGTGNFSGPTGVAVDTQGRIYVVDNGNNRIVRMNDISGDGFTPLGITVLGSNNFNYPIGIALDAQNRVYVADTGNNRIVRLDNTNAAAFANGTGFVSLGPPGSFSSPYSVGVDTQNTVYAGEVNPGKIVRREEGGNIVTYSGAIGSVTGIALDYQNHIYAAIYDLNHPMVYFDSINAQGVKSGYVIYNNGAAPQNFYFLYYPFSLAVY